MTAAHIAYRTSVRIAGVAVGDMAVGPQKRLFTRVSIAGRDQFPTCTSTRRQGSAWVEGMKIVSCHSALLRGPGMERVTAGESFNP